MFHLSSNIKVLRKKQGYTQSQLAEAIGVKTNTISNYENGISTPDFILLEKIIKILDVNAHDILYSDFSDTNFKTKCEENVIVSKPNKNPNKNYTLPNVPNLLGISEASFETSCAQDLIDNDHNLYTFRSDDDNFTEVPIADISVAAGGGSINSDYYDINGSIKLPKSMLSSGKHLCVKVDGRSMEPTLPHASKVVIRLLDRNEWRSIKDDRVYVITDRDGGTYIKRCTNRLHSEGLLILTSDNTAYTPFSLLEDELHNVWAVEWFMMSHLPNKRAEDELWRTSIESDVAEMKQQLTKVLRVIDKGDLKNN